MMFARTATERDLPAIRALLVETWRATYDTIYGAERVTAIADEWRSVAALKAQLLRPNAEFIVADDGNRIGATAYAASTADPKIVMLHRLYVAPASQGGGLGSMLLREIEDSFPDARVLRLEVDAANARAAAFYNARGFVRTGETANCGDARSAIPAIVMEKALA